MATLEQRANCAKLAKLLTRIPDDQHNQEVWADYDKHACKTVGCAFGWAMMSGEFPGLNYCVRAPGTSDYAITVDEGMRILADSYWNICPVVDGECTGIKDAACSYFGDVARYYVFVRTDLTKPECIRRLRRIAKTGAI